MNSHPSVLTQKSAGRGNDNPKTDVVVPVVGCVPVTICRAAVPRIVVPSGLQLDEVQAMWGDPRLLGEVGDLCTSLIRKALYYYPSLIV